MEQVGRFIILAGTALLLLGGLFVVLGHFGVRSLPGDLFFKRGNLRVIIPLGTSLLLSLLLTLGANFLFRK